MFFKRILKLSLTLVSGSFFLTASAQQAWTIYNTSNSPLVDNHVQVISVDPANNKWIGTPSGLVMYNDVSWVTYTTANSGLPDNDIRAVAFDSTGNVWVGTFTGGLAKYDGSAWTVYNMLNSGLPDDFVRALAVDAQNNLWVGTTGGLAKYDGSLWTIWSSANSPFISDNITSIALKGGTKYIGTVNGGIVYLSDTIFASYTLANSGLQDNTVLSIALDSTGNRWLATVGQGAMEHTPVNFWVWINPNNSPLPAWSVYSVIVDPQQNKYFATFAGIARMSGSSWRVYNSVNSPFPDDDFRSIAKDQNGIVWSGGNTVGLVRLDENILNTIEEQDVQEMKLYPSLLHSGEAILFRGEGNAEVMVLDAAGRMCLQANVNNEPGLKLDLAAGVYHVIVTQGKKRQIAKLVLIN